ncbi:PulJ/GspJ family protein [Pseudomonas matsuisoli]|uniref:MSHA biogenesis protein MshO n=1 Tax=Pseudomonas matsuisoli TaxID=1515666 RepID=A0A917V0L0_9PSED|nr:type II secretion system protein [Pseudomonas matsuisoli]GGK04296.1 hypothetical protein GCM10009304_32870 [Pseudomonas matsuisoli]
MKHSRAFTLVELIIVIAVSSVVAIMISTILSRPMQGLVDQSRRSALVDMATVALDRMARDIRLAVPNSLRLSGACVSGGANCRVELLRAQIGGRYRASPDASNVRRDPPTCAASPCTVEVLSPFNGTDQALMSTINWMVIYNVGGSEAGSNVWPNGSATGPAVVSPKVAVTLTSSNALSLSGSGVAGFSFKYASPQHRFYLADKVVGYDCAGGALRRQEFTSLAATGDYNYSAAAPLASGVSACVFRYDPGTARRNGLITLQLTLAKGGEQITLMKQVHVDNAP